MAKRNTKPAEATQEEVEETVVEDMVDEVVEDGQPHGVVPTEDAPPIEDSDKVDSVNPVDEETPPSDDGGSAQDAPLQEDEAEPELPPSIVFGQPHKAVGTEVSISKTRGVYMVAMGNKAREAAIRSVGTLHRTNPKLPITVVSDRVLGVSGVSDIRPESDSPVVEKLNADRRAPYGYVAYLDADTYANADLDAGFAVLEDGWDMVVVPSNKKGEPLLAGVNVEEVAATCAAVGTYEPLRLQGTCIFFRKSSAVHAFFKAWREEWNRHKGLDRAAMLRALKRAPIRVWFFGESYVNGSVISHHRGTAKG